MIKIIILCIAGALFIGLVLFMILRVLRARRNSPSEKENGLPPLLDIADGKDYLHIVNYYAGDC